MNTYASAHTHELGEEIRNPVYQAYQLLHLGFVVLPIVAGLDKFLVKLGEWKQYLWAPLGTVLGNPTTFMHIVGVVEILVGLIVAVKPRRGGWIMAFWLWAIIFNLLLAHDYYDIALRDFGLSLGALALARLASHTDRQNAMDLTAPK
ncbi:MAG TPA: hypothetical protein VHB20_15930 [Verrucomicrobiae bacterium]|jgi:hypothetical protein|nr:hypothetical protein [Verrucomicrobiae bacterium]